MQKQNSEDIATKKNTKEDEIRAEVEALLEQLAQEYLAEML